jgi:hypothetical protein
MLHPFPRRDASQYTENKFLKKITGATQVIKFWKFSRNRNQRFSFPKINRGHDVIKKNQITEQQQHGQTVNTISCKKCTCNPKP